MQAGATCADDGPRTRELMVLWVLDGDAVVGAGEGARVGGLALVPIASLGPLSRFLHVGADLVLGGGSDAGSEAGSWG